LEYQLDAPSLGVFNRQGFVEGWRSLGYHRLRFVSNRRCDNIQNMAFKVAQLREQFKIDDQFHKRVYLFTYAFARPEGQRSLRTPPGS
jgi:DCN1-like protein 1/2